MIREGLHEVSVFSVCCKIFGTTSRADPVVKRPDQLPLEPLVGWGWRKQSNATSPRKMTVSVVHLEKVPSTVTPDLPAQLQAYTEAPIFAQTSGYLRAWHFDIGTKVKANDILAEIDTPEVDQELTQATAQFKVAQSALKLSLVTYQRNQDLFKRRVIAPQDLDTAADTYCENQATAAADEANIDRLYALEAFKLVRAPFDGIVKARDTDIGAYVAAACKPAFATTSSKCAATVVKPFSPNSIPSKKS